MAFDFLNIFGDSKLKQLETEMDNIIKNAPQQRIQTQTSDTVSSDILDGFLKPADQEDDNSKSKKMFNQKEGVFSEVSSLLDKLVIQPDRANRYRVYEEMYKSVPMISRMMKVWLSNLCQKNPVTGRSLIFKDKDEENLNLKNDEQYENKKQAVEVFLTEMIDYFELLEKLKFRIIPVQQMYGDCFVEVVHVDEWAETDSLETKKLNSFIGESSLFNESKNSQSTNDLSSVQRYVETMTDGNIPDWVFESIANYLVSDTQDTVMTESLLNYDENEKVKLNYLQETKNSNVDNMSAFYEYFIGEGGKAVPSLKTFIKPEKLEEPKKRGRKPKNDTKPITENYEDFINKESIPEEIDFSSILMLIHHPRNILILQTDYGTKLGFVELAQESAASVTNVAQQLSTVIGRIVSAGNKSSVSQEEIIARIIRAIVTKIVTDASGQKQLSNKKVDVEKVLKSMNPEIYNAIKKLLIETQKSDPKRSQFRKIKARFIPLQKMFQFSVPSSEYAPYGQSYIDPLILQGKLYILSQLSNIITKLSRAALVRKWTIDVGATQMHAKYIQQVKRELYNQRVSLEDIMSFKSMPKLLSDFKDVFTLSKGGNKSIDLELQSFGEPSIKVADLEDSRRELIALSGIPAPYLGYADVVELQSQLV